MSLLLNALKKAEEGDKSQEDAVAAESGESAAPTEVGAAPVTAESAPPQEAVAVASAAESAESPGQAQAAPAADVDFDSLVEESPAAEAAQGAPREGEAKRQRVDAARIFAAGDGAGGEDIAASGKKKLLIGALSLAVVGGGGYFAFVGGFIPGDLLGISSRSVDVVATPQQSTQPSGVEALTLDENVVLLPVPRVDIPSEVDFALLRRPSGVGDSDENSQLVSQIAILTGYDIRKELQREREEEEQLRLDLEEAARTEQELRGEVEEAEPVESEEEVVVEIVEQTADGSRAAKRRLDSQTPSESKLALAVQIKTSGGSLRGEEQAAQTSAQAPAQVAQVEVKFSQEGLERKRLLEQAQQLYYSGQYVEAETIYRRILVSDKTNLDALRALAQIAINTRRYQAAVATYLDILDYYPNDPVAVAELTNLQAGSNENFYEIEKALKNLLGKRSEADSRIYFALGNLYAGRQNWTLAQRAYFDAFSREVNNPDYAYNLAVVLDYLNKPALALQYYHQALVLSEGSIIGFNVAEVEKRVRDLNNE